MKEEKKTVSQNLSISDLHQRLVGLSSSTQNENYIPPNFFKTKTLSKIYDKKIKIYGDIVETTDYDQLQFSYSVSGRDTTRKKEGTRSARSLTRSKENLYSLVTANVGRHGDFRPIFATLTFAEDVECLSSANRHFGLFNKRLQYVTKLAPRYVAVPEIQEQRAETYGVYVWHYHVIYFNLPFIPVDEFEHIWRNGMTKIEVAESLEACASYLHKYFVKSYFDNKLFGRRVVMASRGLVRPIELFTDGELYSPPIGARLVTASVWNVPGIKKTKQYIVMLEGIVNVKYVMGGISAKSHRPYLQVSDGISAVFFSISPDVEITPDTFTKYERGDDIQLRVAVNPFSGRVIVTEII